MVHTHMLGAEKGGEVGHQGSQLGLQVAVRDQHAEARRAQGWLRQQAAQAAAMALGELGRLPLYQLLERRHALLNKETIKQE